MEHPFLMFLEHTRRSTVGRAARLLRSWVRIPPGAWIFVCCEWRVLSGRGLCDELITCPEESYRMCCVVCDLETSRMGAPYIYDISRLRLKILSLLIIFRFYHNYLLKCATAFVPSPYMMKMSLFLPPLKVISMAVS